MCQVQENSDKDLVLAPSKIAISVCGRVVGRIMTPASKMSVFESPELVNILGYMGKRELRLQMELSLL